MLLYPATTVRRIKEAKRLGINATINSIDFTGIMERTYRLISSESRQIEDSLKHRPLVDLYKTNGTFIGDYTVNVDREEIDIFTEPEIASIGMKEEEAAKKHDILVGYYRYQDTAIGEAMMVKDYFAKIIVDRDGYRILGAHIAGPEASILIQEIVTLMYTDARPAIPIFRGMHIHPALPEVVEKAFFNLREPEAPHNHHEH